MTPVPFSVEEVLTHWGVTADRLDAAPNGTNNATQLVTAGSDLYVLRINGWLDEGQLEAEARLLDRLNSAGMGLRVPSPLPGIDGSRQVVVTGVGRATLTRFIPGRRPVLDSPDAFHRFGIAVGTLDAALAEIPDHALMSDWTGGPMTLVSGAVEVGALARSLAEAGVPHAQTGPMVGYAATMLTSWDSWTAELPRQLVHGDLAASNALVDQAGTVIAMLDFELSGLDVRVQDLVSALWQTDALDRPSWTRALVAGWASGHVLTTPEVEALPRLLEARAFGSVLWRAKQWSAGRASIEDVSQRLARFNECRTWVKAHGKELIAVGTEYASP